MASANASNPQTWNRYSYVLNNPLKHTDPTGMTVAEYDQMSQAAIEKRRWFHAEKQAEQPADTSSTPAEQAQAPTQQPQNTALTQQQSTARDLLGECSVRAMLDTLAFSEHADYDTVVMGTVLRLPVTQSWLERQTLKSRTFLNTPIFLSKPGAGKARLPVVINS